MASHEFRTPLSVVISSADLARLHAIKGNFEEHEKHIQRIKNSAKNLTELLNNSLTADKLEQGFILPESSHFNIKKTIEEVVADLNDLCMENQTIRCIHNGNEEIITDRKILKNILFNLVTNAIKYSQKEVIITTNSYLGKMEISVKDNGIGIPVKEQKHLFSRFFRASNVSHIQGIGIGLNIVHSYARVLGGSIDFISSKRKGSIFTLSIPNNATFENLS